MAKRDMDIVVISDDDSDNGQGSGRPSKKYKASAERENDYGCSSGSKQQGPISGKARQVDTTTAPESMMASGGSFLCANAALAALPKVAKRAPSSIEIMQKDRYDIGLLQDWQKKFLPLHKTFNKDFTRRNGDNSRSWVSMDDVYAELANPAHYAAQARATREDKDSRIDEMEALLNDVMGKLKAIKQDEDPLSLSKSHTEDAGDLNRRPIMETERQDAQVTSIKDPLCFLPKQEPNCGDDEELLGIPHHPIKLEQQDEQTVLYGDQALGQNYETNQAIIPMFASQHNNETTNEVKDNDGDRDRLLREALEQQLFTPHPTSTPLQMPPITDNFLQVGTAHDVDQGPEVQEDDRASTAGQWVT